MAYRRRAAADRKQPVGPSRDDDPCRGNLRPDAGERQPDEVAGPRGRDEKRRGDLELREHGRQLGERPADDHGRRSSRANSTNPRAARQPPERAGRAHARGRSRDARVLDRALGAACPPSRSASTDEREMNDAVARLDGARDRFLQAELEPDVEDLAGARLVRKLDQLADAGTFCITIRSAPRSSITVVPANRWPGGHARITLPAGILRFRSKTTPRWRCAAPTTPSPASTATWSTIVCASKTEDDVQPGWPSSGIRRGDARARSRRARSRPRFRTGRRAPRSRPRRPRRPPAPRA